MPKWRQTVKMRTFSGCAGKSEAEAYVPSCCSVVAFTGAARFSVCSKLSYASFAALYFFCEEDERRKQNAERDRGFV